MKCYIALIFCTLGFSGVAAAQEARAVVTETAPIYLTPDATRTPLRTAAVDTQLRVRGEEGNWLRVEFQDPQFGQRTGYVQANHVRVSRPDLEPMDLSIPAGTSATRTSPARSIRSDDREATYQERRFPERSSQMPGVSRHNREGFWFNAGLGYGSLGCDGCSDRRNGGSGGLSLGRAISPRLLLGVGTTGWARTDTELTVGTLDARVRFYPSETSGFFLTGGLGLGALSSGGVNEVGLGAVLGLSMDIRVGRNVSLTPFWSGFATRSLTFDANVGQLGLGITIH